MRCSCYTPSNGQSMSKPIFLAAVAAERSAAAAAAATCLMLVSAECCATRAQLAQGGLRARCTWSHELARYQPS